MKNVNSPKNDYLCKASEYIVCRLSNNQTTKEKCKLAFKGTSVKKTKDFV